MVGRDEAARTRHVLRHDRRRARNVSPEIAGDQARAEVVARAGIVADDEADLPSGVEVLSMGWGGEKKGQGKDEQKPSPPRGKGKGEGVTDVGHPLRRRTEIGASRKSHHFFKDPSPRL